MIYRNEIYGTKNFEYAQFFREIALEIEANPDAILNYTDHPAIQELVRDENSTCLERVQRMEAMSYGDAGVMLSCPGPSLSGLIIREIGSDNQKKQFFNFVQSKSARTLFALTEPDYGSEANQIGSHLQCQSDGTYQLSAKKCLFGNGVCATIGVVLAKVANGPLGMRAILLTPELLADPHKIKRKKLKCSGLKGAQLSYLECENISIHTDLILGSHLNPIRTGMMAIIMTFNRMRPGVAAIALGHAQAQLDYWYEHAKKYRRTFKDKMDNLQFKCRAIRNYLHETAIQVDKDPLQQVHSSQVKLMATHIAEEIAEEILNYFGKSLYIDHPLLSKWMRDVYAFEYMEGTTNIQLNNIYQNYQQELQQGGEI